MELESKGLEESDSVSADGRVNDFERLCLFERKGLREDEKRKLIGLEKMRVE